MKIEYRFTGFFKLANRVLYFASAIFLIVGLILTVAVKPAQACAYTLNLSHIQCTANKIEVHFVLLDVPDGITPGNVTFKVNVNSTTIFNPSIAPSSHTGNVWHYYWYGNINGKYNVTEASVLVNGETVTLHNPGDYQDVDQNCVTTITPTNTEVPTHTPTRTSVPTLTPTNTEIPTFTPTNTEVPTLTPTNTEIPTLTPTNTEIPTLTPTNTEVPTLTPTNTEVPTLTPTNTEVPTLTPTNTEVPTSTPTNTEVPSATPTNTEGPSPTPTNTNAPTLTPTNTQVPSATPTNTVVVSPTSTNTQTPQIPTTVPTTSTPVLPPVLLQPVSLGVDPFCTDGGGMQWTVINPNSQNFTIDYYTIDGGSRQTSLIIPPGEHNLIITELGTHAVTLFFGGSSSVSLTYTLVDCKLPIPETGTGENLMIPVTGTDLTNILGNSLIFASLVFAGLGLLLSSLRKLLSL
jgi:hypothetical protein